jgi:hypothetical protein
MAGSEGTSSLPNSLTELSRYVHYRTEQLISDALGVFRYRQLSPDNVRLLILSRLSHHFEAQQCQELLGAFSEAVDAKRKIRQDLKIQVNPLASQLFSLHWMSPTASGIGDTALTRRRVAAVRERISHAKAKILKLEVENNRLYRGTNSESDAALFIRKRPTRDPDDELRDEERAHEAHCDKLRTINESLQNEINLLENKIDSINAAGDVSEGRFEEFEGIDSV